MSAYAVELAADRDLLIGTGPLVVGLVIVVLCVAAVWWGIRLRAREPMASRRSQPRSGAWQEPGETDRAARESGHGPGHQNGDDGVGYVTEHREPDALPRDGARRRPHELGGSGTRESD
ncbi:hypothetical protein HUT19_24575 [Streptomyces sp. NA02950]|uniref:DUF6479 family protein n=1 Tax=Streptomyces sp. NA02950 TaxID=2742137 RepID=UPI001590D61B|nr:DUF6479 family protein [Streptomyces sp. NA02950]QKV94537.1 hypothetical protein HUT19_24575 [Streptomyces sp. NA02950]